MGNVYCNSGSIFQNHPTSVANAYPHSICVNSPVLQAMYPETTPTYRTKTTGWVDINRWATFYEYCTIYETDIVLTVGNLFSLDAGYTNGYAQGEDAFYLYYCLPNVDIPSNVAGTAYNPWGLQSSTTPVSTVMRTPKIRRIKLKFPNTTGRDTSFTLRIKWKLKDVGTNNLGYMLKSVASNFNGTSWNEPLDRTGFDTNLSQKRHMFYFWMGTDNATAQYNMQARWNVKLYSKVKFWQPRANALAPTLSFKTAEDDSNSDDQEEPQDQMDFETLEPYPESVPSTPLLSQLTQELANMGHAKVSQKKKI